MTIDVATALNSITTAKELTARGFSLTAAPDSLLNELVDASKSLFSSQSQSSTNPVVLFRDPSKRAGLGDIQANEFATELNCFTRNYDEPSAQSAIIGSFVDEISPLILSHISFARNVVKPAVVELADRLQKYKETAKAIDPASQFTIVKGQIPAVLLDESFLEDGIKNYETLPIGEKPIAYLSLDLDRTDEFFTNLMMVGNERINGMIKAWLGTKEPDFVRNCFATNFGDLSATPNVSDLHQKYAIGVETRPVYRRLDIALACYIMATKLLVDVQPSVNSDPLAYKKAVREMIDYAGSVAMASMRTIQRQIRNNVLVADAILSEKTIVVHNALYSNWLADGGTPEVLLGMLVSGAVQYPIAEINANKKTLIKHWNNYLMFSASDNHADLKQRFAAFLESDVLFGLNSLTDEEQEYSKTVPTFKDVVAKRAKIAIDELTACLMDDVNYTALYVLGKSRFYYTKAFDILNGIDQVSKAANGEIDVREAATLSVIDYIADFLFDQVVVSK